MNPSRWTTSIWLPVVLIVLAISVVYAPVASHSFVNLDDPAYVTDNYAVLQGLFSDVWTQLLTHPYAGNWHPLTMVSHAADVEFLGVSPGAHHVVNGLLHALAALFLFAALREVTGAHWPSFWVALIVAVHPLNVESVAWISQRKSVLCMALLMASWFAYGRARTRRNAGSVVAYLLFVLALLAKPMAVVFPLLLLLTDFWPLRRVERLHPAAWGPLLKEKTIWFLIAFVMGGITIWAQSRVGAVSSVDALPIPVRLANAFVSVFRYTDRFLWPSHLAVFYPYSLDALSWVRVVLSVLGVVVVSAGALSVAKRYPALTFGWFWYLISLIPVIGLIQVGGQSSADRYAYLPGIGLSVAVVWSIVSWIEAKPQWRQVIVATCLCGFLVLGVVARFQVMVWRDNFSLYLHALTAAPGNYLAFNNVGVALRDLGRFDEAAEQFERAIELKPDWSLPYLNLGLVRVHQGRLDEAEGLYQEALARDQGNNPLSHHQLGNLLMVQGRLEEALYQFRETLKLDPYRAESQSNIGLILMQQGRKEEGLASFEKALSLQPGNGLILRNLALAYLSNQDLPAALGALDRADERTCSHPSILALRALIHSEMNQPDEAIALYRQVLAMQPDHPQALNGLAWSYVSDTNRLAGHEAEAVSLAEKAVEVTHRRTPELLNTLAAAYAAQGRYREAVEVSDEALALVDTPGQGPLFLQIKAYRDQYAAEIGIPSEEGRP
ncbi:MAG: tetratricopeptide repeat protein [Kiritimatiellae bacterium]|nr:tetratricopeptide repeat protein [Kiritimatiellia bacterium]